MQTVPTQICTISFTIKINISWGSVIRENNLKSFFRTHNVGWRRGELEKQISLQGVPGAMTGTGQVSDDISSPPGAHVQGQPCFLFF